MFLVVHEDKPIYELDFSQTEKQVKEYFLVHSSLDNIDLMLKNKRDYFLGQIKTDDILLFAYVNAAQIKMILVLGPRKEIDKQIEKSIKEFFIKVNESLALAFLNPLYRPKEYIKSSAFDERVKVAVKQNLKGVLGDKKK